MDNKSIKPYSNYLFNFSSSYSGGGLKRLTAYVEWLDNQGGAHFIINENLKESFNHFSRNTYHFVKINSFKKFINSQKYVDLIIREMGECHFCYSYNIPVKKNLAKINWFHLSNVLPYTNMSIFNIPYRRKIELWWLGLLTKQGLKYCNFISAESSFSLGLLNIEKSERNIISPNGSDQEITAIKNILLDSAMKNTAIVTGTYHHKNLLDSYKIFKHLKLNNSDLKLIIFGDKSTVPEVIRCDTFVELKGIKPHENIIENLSKSRFYINTSKIENSWNAASEGVFLANESYISKIPPHDELLKNCEVKILNNFETFDKVMHVSRDFLKTDKLQTWDEIIISMMKSVEKNYEI